MTDALPRLVYVGDVPVRASQGGSLVLYRLLQNYPKDKLLIVEGTLDRGQSGHSLPDVSYTQVSNGSWRLLHSRFSRAYASWLTLSAPWKRRRIAAILKSFRAQAVLTVAHGYGWITAAIAATKSGLPLHLVVHDDWPRIANVFQPVKGALDRRFGEIYRGAASRWCISPFMAEFYHARYGARGEILYPFRAADALEFSEPPARCMIDQTALAVAVAGTINSGGYARILRVIAKVLETVGGRLLLYGPLSPADIRFWELTAPSIEYKGLLGSTTDLIIALREEADVLLVPMSFDEGAHTEQTRFPSKLADYTAVGLPILICGPDICSAADWARKVGPIAELVSSTDAEEIASALARLSNAQYRRFLGDRALDIGRRFFSHEAAQERLFRALRAPSVIDGRAARFSPESR